MGHTTNSAPCEVEGTLQQQNLHIFSSGATVIGAAMRAFPLLLVLGTALGFGRFSTTARTSTFAKQLSNIANVRESSLSAATIDVERLAQLI